MPFAQTVFGLTLLILVVLEAEVSAEVANARLRPARMLVFVREGDSTCTVSVFDANTRGIRRLAGTNACPTGIVALAERSSVFLFDDEWMQEVEVALGRSHPRRARPKPETPLAFGLHRPEHVGLRPDDSLFLLLTGSREKNAKDGTEFLLFVDRDGVWSLSRSGFCAWYEFDCLAVWRVARPKREGTDYFGDDARIWHERQLGNPFVRGRTSRSDGEHAGMPRTRWELYFDLAGRSSTLRFWTIPGPDSGDTLTLAIDLVLDDGDPRPIAKRQCDGRLMGRYLLVDRNVEHPTRLIDLLTGEDVLGPLALAEWAY